MVKDRINMMPQAYEPRVGDFILPPEVQHTFTSAVQPADQIVTSLFLLQRRMRFDQIAIRVDAAGAGGALCRLGLYNVDEDYYPSTLILDAGTIDGTVVANNVIIIDETLDRGWYALAILTNDATIQFRYRTTSISPLGGISATSVVNAGWLVASAFAALPDPHPAGGNIQGRRYGGLRLAELL